MTRLRRAVDEAVADAARAAGAAFFAGRNPREGYSVDVRERAAAEGAAPAVDGAAPVAELEAEESELAAEGVALALALLPAPAHMSAPEAAAAWLAGALGRVRWSGAACVSGLGAGARIAAPRGGVAIGMSGEGAACFGRA